jgi:2-polyprenyl-6-hydroxyphenyl methylase/3-demethylubiquinone-9 3-methyltransferase
MKLRWKIAQAAELRWWKNYLKNKSVSSYLSDKKNYWKSVLREMEVVPKSGNKILDAGCGPAGIFTILEDYEVDAIDPLLEDYELSLPHFNRKTYPNVQFFNTTIEGFKPSQTYDLIFCLNAINHVDNLNKSLDNLFLALSEGGKLILSTDTHKHAFLKPIFKAIPGDILHPHQYDLEEYREMLLKRGARIEKEICLKKGNIFDYWVWVIGI